jgi:hypothetical protein
MIWLQITQGEMPMIKHEKTLAIPVSALAVYQASINLLEHEKFRSRWGFKQRARIHSANPATGTVTARFFNRLRIDVTVMGDITQSTARITVIDRLLIIDPLGEVERQVDALCNGLMQRVAPAIGSVEAQTSLAATPAAKAYVTNPVRTTFMETRAGTAFQWARLIWRIIILVGIIGTIIGAIITAAANVHQP